MKTSLRIAVLTAFAIFASLWMTLHAQTSITRAQIDVPFAFNYGSAHLSPGRYTIDTQSPNLLVLHGATGSVMAMTRAEENRRPVKAGHAIFTKYGDRFVLDEVWIAGNSAHLDVYHANPKQRAESVASNTGAPTQVELALLSMPNAASAR